MKWMVFWKVPQEAENLRHCYRTPHLTVAELRALMGELSRIGYVSICAMPRG